ncbi:hypothetical protein [Antarcticirhabdus aurantiaca]|uniref:Uncharacterized protein n=1 Tax=Antarcticirhabdus aurantiaca TaxID=2606717 RepID=A0ACD4NX72_9HYPH|nr:hypothetical protein [Antarcticirhabdus aurantiaca]WAJ31621.1 hypothetical protein OXU80_28060 [Jeongeuplla avenae]
MQIDILLFDEASGDGLSSATRFGGLPSASGDFTWPTCRSCDGEMQFLGQVRSPTSERLHLVFMCQNNPGVCSEWDADKGANAVICTATDGLRIAPAPSDGETVRATLYGARVERVRASSYDEARSGWSERHPGRQREVLGQIGGEPDWLQGDETPRCDHCNEPMRFVAQIEEGPDYDTGMNFAGGCGYLFECGCVGGRGKFLWQS